ncbi:MAG: PepSY domain-containing protein [Candidatus Sedimenticola sp. 20ELBAFRAG]
MQKVFYLIALLSIVGLSGVVMGDDDDFDHLESRRLVEEGRIKPLQEILSLVTSQRPGAILEVELERDDGIMIYEIEMLGDDGRVWEMEINARTGEIIESHEED